MKNRRFNLSTLVKLAFIVFVFIAIIVLSAGFSFELEKLQDISFWVLVGLRLVATLIIYNLVFSIDAASRRTDDKSLYYSTAVTYELRVEKIYKDKLFGELDKAIEAENKEKYIRACNKLLRRTIGRVSYEDIFDERGIKSGAIEEISKRYILNDKQIKLLQTAIKKISAGKVDYEQIEPDDILIDKHAEKESKDTIKFNINTFLAKQNIVRSLTFLASTIIMTIISFTSKSINVWDLIITNTVLLLSAVVSAVMMSYNYIKTRTNVYKRRNKFLSRRLDINDEYEN